MLYSKVEEISNSKMRQLVMRRVKIAHSQNLKIKITWGLG
jgi:hypothetical protein